MRILWIDSADKMNGYPAFKQENEQTTPWLSARKTSTPNECRYDLQS
jgi:hypothetical protein